MVQLKVAKIFSLSWLPIEAVSICLGATFLLIFDTRRRRDFGTYILYVSKLS